MSIEVIIKRKAVPMKGEIPHRKGKIMSGRFPGRAAEHFIKALKGLSGNANQNDIEEPIITKAVANIGARPFGKSGMRKKRSHIKIIVTEKSSIKKLKKKNGRKKDSKI